MVKRRRKKDYTPWVLAAAVLLILGCYKPGGTGGVTTTTSGTVPYWQTTTSMSVTTTTVASFDDIMDCDNSCRSRGYSSGSCLWPSEAALYYVNIGPCVIAGSRHCMSFGQCNCYCIPYSITTTTSSATTTTTSYTTTTTVDCDAWANSFGYTHGVPYEATGGECHVYCINWCDSNDLGDCAGSVTNLICCAYRCYDEL